MGWVRISDDFYDHEKFYGVTALGVAVWIAGLAHANRNLTDGIVSKRAARGLVSVDGIDIDLTPGSELTGAGRSAEPEDGVEELVVAGLWHRHGHDCPSCPQPGRGAYVIHDYFDYQPSRDEVAELKATRAEAGRRGGKASAQAKAQAKAQANGQAKSNPQSQTQDLTLSNVSHLPERARMTDDITDARAAVLSGLGITDYPKIKAAIVQATGRDVADELAMRIIAGVLSKATETVRKPQAYVLGSIRDSWAEIQRDIDEGVA